MARSRIIPGAQQHRWAGVSGIAQPTITKLVLHSTETSARWGCPGYAAGRNAPTVTVDPWNKITWQHFDANESAKALLDPGSTSVRENRDNVAQVEIIGYSDANIARRYGYDLRDLDPAGLDYIARIIRFYHAEWEVPLRIPRRWPMYPDSYGNTSARMTGPEYDAFTGVLGHLHVSGNSHGDPALDIAALMAAAIRDTTKPTDPMGEIMSWYKDRQAFEVRIAEIVAKYVPRATFWGGTRDGKGRKITINVATGLRWAHKIGRDNRIKNTRSEGKINGLTAAVQVLADKVGADHDDIARLIAQGVEDVKAEIPTEDSDARELAAFAAEYEDEDA